MKITAKCGHCNGTLWTSWTGLIFWSDDSVLAFEGWVDPDPCSPSPWLHSCIRDDYQVGAQSVLFPSSACCLSSRIWELCLSAQSPCRERDESLFWSPRLLAPRILSAPDVRWSVCSLRDDIVAALVSGTCCSIHRAPPHPSLTAKDQACPSLISWERLSPSWPPGVDVFPKRPVLPVC